MANILDYSNNKKLKPWEKTSSACGYAVFDKNIDTGAASVFKRADDDMYKHKI